MAYGADVLAEAQELYFAGWSAARIAVELKKRHPASCKRICEKTVLAWISTPDGEGKTWLDKKAIVHQKAEGKLIDKSVDRMSQLHGALDDFISDLQKRFDRVKDNASNSPEYLAQVILQFIVHREKTLQTAAVGVTSDEQMRIFFEVLQSDPELGPVFERRRAAISAAYREKLKG